MGFTLHPTLAKDTVLAARVGPLQVRLVDDARFFWLVIVPETTATELHDLDEKTLNLFNKIDDRSVELLDNYYTVIAIEFNKPIKLYREHSGAIESN